MGKLDHPLGRMRQKKFQRPMVVEQPIGTASNEALHGNEIRSWGTGINRQGLYLFWMKLQWILYYKLCHGLLVRTETKMSEIRSKIGRRSDGRDVSNGHRHAAGG